MQSLWRYLCIRQELHSPAGNFGVILPNVSYLRCGYDSGEHPHWRNCDRLVMQALRNQFYQLRTRSEARLRWTVKRQPIGRAARKQTEQTSIFFCAQVSRVNRAAAEQRVICEEDLAVVSIRLGRVESHKHQRVSQVRGLGVAECRSRNAVIVVVL